jgi:hypothetical protein
MTPLATLPRNAVSNPSVDIRITESPFSPRRVDVAIRVAEGEPEPWWAKPVEERLELLSHLQNDWNSHGARQPREEAVLIGVRVIASLLGSHENWPLPQIVPTWQGGLQLEWHLQAGDVEITVDPRDAVWAYLTHQNITVDGPLTELESRVSEVLGQAAH